MSNSEIFILFVSQISTTSVYLNWFVSPYSPTDTIETDTFYVSYTNQSTLQTNVVNVGSLMNTVLQLEPLNRYSIVVYSINQSLAQSVDSNIVEVTTGDYVINTYSANGGVRPYGPPEQYNRVTIEDLNNVTTVSASNLGVTSAEPTFVDIVKPSSPKPFYQLYKIDPKGELFGNTPCGYFNFKKRTIRL